MGKVISDYEWADFIDNNIVSDDVIEIIAIRISINQELTEREICIYEEYSTIIENKIKEI